MIVTYKSAEGFFLAPLYAVAKSRQSNVTAAALEQRVSPFYATQEAAEAALVVKRREYDGAGA